MFEGKMYTLENFLIQPIKLLRTPMKAYKLMVALICTANITEIAWCEWEFQRRNLLNPSRFLLHYRENNWRLPVVIFLQCWNYFFYDSDRTILFWNRWRALELLKHSNRMPIIMIVDWPGRKDSRTSPVATSCNSL